MKNKGKKETPEKKLPKGIFRRDHSKYLWISYAGSDNRLRRESTNSTKIKVAQDLLHKRKAEVLEGKEPQIVRIKNHAFKDLAEEYKKWAMRQRGYADKERKIDQLVARFGNLPLRSFNTMLVEQYQTERMKEGLRNRPNKPATINRLIATLKHMFTRAVDWNWVEEEVLKRVRKVKMLPENNKRLRYLSKEECQRLTAVCDKYLRPVVIMALNTGMRRSEMLNLTWEQVDLNHGFILLDITKNGERREIPINQNARQVLKNVVRRLDVSYVFYHPKTGEPYKDFKKGFKAACRSAKIANFRFHDLRHTFASHLVMGGVDLSTVQKLLGHKTLTMTLRYAHLSPAHIARAVNVLDSALDLTPASPLTVVAGGASVTP